jgi:hypothetical protein
MSSSRQLAAITFTDIAGYTAMMQHNGQNGLWRPEIKAYLEKIDTRNKQMIDAIMKSKIVLIDPFVSFLE